MDINNLVLAGRLTKDPELRYTPDGRPVASITMAVNRSFKNAREEREADFINCVIWNKRAEAIANHFKKGDEIGVIGRIQTRFYENDEGKRVYVTEVVVESFSFGQKSGGNNNRNTNGAGGGQNTGSGHQGRNNDNQYYGQEPPPIDIGDDDLPF